MSDHHFFMVFGLAIASGGFYLAVTAKSGAGQTTIKLLGAEITLAAAGGIIVIVLGVVTFALPSFLNGTPVSSQAEEAPSTEPNAKSPSVEESHSSESNERNNASNTGQTTQIPIDFHVPIEINKVYVNFFAYNVPYSSQRECQEKIYNWIIKSKYKLYGQYDWSFVIGVNKLTVMMVCNRNKLNIAVSAAENTEENFRSTNLLSVNAAAEFADR